MWVNSRLDKGVLNVHANARMVATYFFLLKKIIRRVSRVLSNSFDRCSRRRKEKLRRLTARCTRTQKITSPDRNRLTAGGRLLSTLFIIQSCIVPVLKTWAIWLFWQRISLFCKFRRVLQRHFGQPSFSNSRVYRTPLQKGIRKTCNVQDSFVAKKKSSKKQERKKKISGTLIS